MSKVMNKFLVNVQLWPAGDATIVQIIYETENDRLSEQDILDICDQLRNKRKGYEPLITYIYKLKSF